MPYKSDVFEVDVGEVVVEVVEDVAEEGARLFRAERGWGIVSVPLAECDGEGDVARGGRLEYIGCEFDGGSQYGSGLLALERVF